MDDGARFTPLARVDPDPPEAAPSELVFRLDPMRALTRSTSIGLAAGLLLAGSVARAQPTPTPEAASTGFEASIRSWVADQKALVPALEQELRREETQAREFRSYLQRIRSDAAGQKAMLALGNMRPYDLSRAGNNWNAWHTVAEARASRVDALTESVAQRKQEQQDRWELLGDDVAADLPSEGAQLYQQAQALQKQTVALLDRLQLLAANGAHDAESAVSVCDDVLGLVVRAAERLRSRFFFDRVTLASLGTAFDDLQKDVAALVEPLTDVVAEGWRVRLSDWLRANAQVLVTAVLLLSLAVWRARRAVGRLEAAARRVGGSGASFHRRLGMAALLAAADVAGLAVSTLAALVLLAAFDASVPTWVRALVSLLGAFFVWRFTVAFLRVAFDREVPEHRLFALEAAATDLVRRRLERLALWLFVGTFGANLIRFVGVPSVLLMVAFLVLQLFGVRSVLRTLSEAKLAPLGLVEPWSSAARQWRSLMRGAVVAILGTAALGFVNLAAYAAWAVLKLGGLLLVALLIWRAGADAIDDWGRALDDAARRPLRRLWNAAMMVAVVLLVPVLDGFDDTLWRWGWAILSASVDISGREITVGQVLAAVVWVLAALMLSRLINAVLTERLFPRAIGDVGVREAITATVGYLLLAAGVLLGIRTLGFDLTSFAIVAGALSVGVGFGMQTLVNNFVSGLIILYERPFRAGDILEHGGVMGSVKKIRTRSTIVQTYDDAELVLPNSELLSKPITNWTLSNHRTRAVIPIGVAYGSDVHLVRDTLLEIAAAHPRILEEPKVLFTAFGDSALEFRLLIWVDIREKGDVVSDLHFSIDQAFRDKRIEIPFPQREVHLHTTGGVG